MTEPFQLSEDERLPRSADSWIDRVRAADAEAEAAWENAYYSQNETSELMVARSLVAIAAELRAQRIARRSGAGKS
jgi:hypothetical protein